MAQTWLSQGAPTLVRRLEANTAARVDCDVLIVGSGYGGAVAAARLGGTVRDDDGGEATVWLLERGREYVPGSFPSRFAELPGHVRFSMQDGAPARGNDGGLFDVRIGADVCTLLGNGLGGGSLINAAVMERAPARAFDARWPEGLRKADALDAGYNAAETMLGPARTPKANECAKLQSFDALVQPSAGAAAERCRIAVHQQQEPASSAAGVELQPCTLCGDCVTGCNQGAKGSLDTNYLAAAWQRGVDMFCGAAVEYVERAADHWLVWWHYTERSHRPAGRRFCVRARHVVLAAGTLGSSEILLRSARAGLALSPQLGRGFSANGDHIAAGLAHATPVHTVGCQECDPADPRARRVGATITGLSNVQHDGQHFVVEEFAVPASLRYVLGELVLTLDAFFTPEDEDVAQRPHAPADRHALSEDTIERMSLYGFMGDDGAGLAASDGSVSGGTLTLAGAAGDGSVEGTLGIRWPHAGTLPLYGAMGTWLKTALHPAVPMPPQDLLNEIGLDTVVTVHPLGGCRIGTGFANGVVDEHGRVFRPDGQPHPGLAVLDGSIVPGPLGINPALTIAALAEQAVPVLRKAWGLTDRASLRVLPARPRRPRRVLTAPHSRWHIVERMTGPLTLGGRAYDASIDVRFDPIGDLRDLVARTDKVVPVSDAALELRDRENGAVHSVALAGHVTLFKPADGGRATLDYALDVTRADSRGPLVAGARLSGVKHVGLQGKTPPDRQPSVWRQLSEMDVRIDGATAGRLLLDQRDLARRRNPLLQLADLSSMPDALGDLIGLALYTLRRSMRSLLANLQFSYTPQPALLALRWPGPVRGHPHRTVALAGGARLTHYQSGAPAATPVLLIHGLGTSGASFTLPPDNLAAFLLRERDVWVLDVRSSIAMEDQRRTPQANDWTVEQIARADLPQAIGHVNAHHGRPIDVIAHCMGAVMFLVAALSTPGLATQIHAVVLSQVGPLLHLSPLNRLRGYVGSYLQQYFRISEFDPCPPAARTGAGQLLNALLATFPYPNDDELEQMSQGGADDQIAVRVAADWIFGQLFEWNNLHPTTQQQLTALLGWVKVRMLSQAIHFARHELLTDARGRNEVLLGKHFAERFGFPVLMIHGAKNAIFESSGSQASWRLLTTLRGGAVDDTPQSIANDARDVGQLWGAGTTTQLAVFEHYGHLDCIIGKQAHADVFPTIRRFFAARLPATKHAAVPVETDPPWIGPMLGWLRIESGRLRANVLVQPQPRRADTQALAVVPVGRDGPLLDEAAVLPWKEGQAVVLDVELSKAQGGLEVLMLPVHQDLPLDALGLTTGIRLHELSGTVTDVEARIGELVVESATVELTIARTTSVSSGVPLAAEPPSWLANAHKASEPQRSAIERCWNSAQKPPLLRLTPQAIRAADRTTITTPKTGLRFALGSCQYPPGLLDAIAADAAQRGLLADVERADGPQFVLLAGDQVYLDATAGVFDPVLTAGAGPAPWPGELDRIYELNWRLPSLRRVAATVPVLTMLDDHEVRNDWQGGTVTPDSAEARALEAYDRYQGPLNPVLKLGNGTTRSYAFYPAGVPFFVLDTRTQRDPRQAGRDGLAINVDDARIVPDGVMDALCRQLREAPPDVAKFIVSPAPLLPLEKHADDAARLTSDTWAGFPASLRALLECIRDVPRVVLLAGDAHLSTVSTLRFDNGNTVVSVVSSGLYTPWPFANQDPAELQLHGSVDGSQAQPLTGTLDTLALSTDWGHALIELSDAHDRLTVHLRPVHGTVDPVICALA